jgi:hypothetical protein
MEAMTGCSGFAAQPSLLEIVLADMLRLSLPADGEGGSPRSPGGGAAIGGDIDDATCDPAGVLFLEYLSALPPNTLAMANDALGRGAPTQGIARACQAAGARGMPKPGAAVPVMSSALLAATLCAPMAVRAVASSLLCPNPSGPLVLLRSCPSPAFAAAAMALPHVRPMLLCEDTEVEVLALALTDTFRKTYEVGPVGAAAMRFLVHLLAHASIGIVLATAKIVNEAAANNDAAMLVAVASAIVVTEQCAPAPDDALGAGGSPPLANTAGANSSGPRVRPDVRASMSYRANAGGASSWRESASRPGTQQRAARMGTPAGSAATATAGSPAAATTHQLPAFLAPWRRHLPSQAVFDTLVAYIAAITRLRELVHMDQMSPLDVRSRALERRQTGSALDAWLHAVRDANVPPFRPIIATETELRRWANACRRNGEPVKASAFRGSGLPPTPFSTAISLRHGLKLTAHVKGGRRGLATGGTAARGAGLTSGNAGGSRSRRGSVSSADSYAETDAGASVREGSARGGSKESGASLADTLSGAVPQQNREELSKRHIERVRYAHESRSDERKRIDRQFAERALGGSESSKMAKEHCILRRIADRKQTQADKFAALQATREGRKQAMLEQWAHLRPKPLARPDVFAWEGSVTFHPEKRPATSMAVSNAGRRKKAPSPLSRSHTPGQPLVLCISTLVQEDGDDHHDKPGSNKHSAVMSPTAKLMDRRRKARIDEKHHHERDVVATAAAKARRKIVAEELKERDAIAASWRGRRGGSSAPAAHALKTCTPAEQGGTSDILSRTPPPIEEVESVSSSVKSTPRKAASSRAASHHSDDAYDDSFNEASNSANPEAKANVAGPGDSAVVVGAPTAPPATTPTAPASPEPSHSPRQQTAAAPPPTVPTSTAPAASSPSQPESARSLDAMSERQPTAAPPADVPEGKPQPPASPTPLPEALDPLRGEAVVEPAPAVVPVSPASSSSRSSSAASSRASSSGEAPAPIPVQSTLPAQPPPPSAPSVAADAPQPIAPVEKAAPQPVSASSSSAGSPSASSTASSRNSSRRGSITDTKPPMAPAVTQPAPPMPIEVTIAEPAPRPTHTTSPAPVATPPRQQLASTTPPSPQAVSPMHSVRSSMAPPTDSDTDTDTDSNSSPSNPGTPPRRGAVTIAERSAQEPPAPTGAADSQRVPSQHQSNRTTSSSSSSSTTDSDDFDADSDDEDDEKRRAAKRAVDDADEADLGDIGANQLASRLRFDGTFRRPVNINQQKERRGADE